MCIEEFDAPVRTNVTAFHGSMEGKSATIVALLIGLGYDILLDNYVPSSLCGLGLKGKLLIITSNQCTYHLKFKLYMYSFLRSGSSWV